MSARWDYSLKWRQSTKIPGEAASCLRFTGAIIRDLMSPLFDEVQKQARMLTAQEKAALALQLKQSYAKMVMAEL